MKGIVCVFSALIISLNLSYSQVNDSTNTGTFTDVRDGKTYKTVQIGKQIWMAENLSYNPGNGSWAYENKSSNEAIYGRLYNWETAKTVCPSGWHLPSDSEWTQLTDYLGGKDIAGGKLKETGKIHWLSPNTGATNETGFTALPGGFHLLDDTFDYIGFTGSWWSATESSTYNAWSLGIFYYFSYVYRIDLSKELGYSVRCVRD